MLLELSVARIALIESISLQLGQGLCVFTGETGAGKSILLDAIGLLLGNRGTSELIRQDAEDALVEGTFAVDATSKTDIANLLRSWDVDFDDNTLVVSRKLYRSGRTVCRINGQMATVQMLRELGSRLVQQHGQHESQSLLRPEEQLRLLDAFGRHDVQVRIVERHYREWRSAQADLEQAQVDDQERARRLDMLSFQMTEIGDGNLVLGEEDDLRQERTKLAHVEKISEAIQQALSSLEGGRTEGAATQVTQAITALQPVASLDNALKDASEMLETAQVHLDEAARELSALVLRLEAEPDRLQQIEDRLALIRALERKYGPSIDAVLDYYAGIVEEYEKYQNHEEELEQLRKEVEACEDRLVESSLRLHQMRLGTAQKFATSLGKVLKQLQMPHASFTIEVVKRTDETGRLEYGPTGTDTVTFLFSANKGAQPRPLQKIASGGELSRTMLSIKAVMAGSDDVQTLIFDEIDAGVSGAAAQRVAEQLLALGQSRQVLCVTHSPQIAASGQFHYQIQKRDRAKDTVTEIQVLDARGRVAEIARLLGSEVADDTANRHAQAMLESFGPIPPMSG